MEINSSFLSLNRKITNYFSSGSEGLSFGDRRFYSWAPLTCILSVLSHIIFMAIFWRLGAIIMVYINIFSILIWLLTIWLTRKRMFLSLIIIGCVEIIAHAALAVHFVGWNSGFHLYMFFVPIAFFHLQGRNKISVVFTFFTCIVYLLLNIFLSRTDPVYNINNQTLLFLYAYNLASMFLLISLNTYLYTKVAANTEREVQIQYDRAENLLANILPRPIAERLKSKEHLIADGFDNVSILFADIHNFTKYSSNMDPTDLVYVLNNLFSTYDNILDKHGIEKIKTIGDTYMVASGLPIENKHHAEKAIDYALEMLSLTEKFNKEYGTNFSLRVGINSGPVTAGVIGKKKFIYDLWGDTVNVASRMESSSICGEIHIAEATYKLIKDKYTVKKRTPIEIKGKGFMQTYLIKNILN